MFKVIDETTNAFCVVKGILLRSNFGIRPNFGPERILNNDAAI